MAPAQWVSHCFPRSSFTIPKKLLAVSSYLHLLLTSFFLFSAISPVTFHLNSDFSSYFLELFQHFFLLSPTISIMLTKQITFSTNTILSSELFSFPLSQSKHRLFVYLLFLIFLTFAAKPGLLLPSYIKLPTGIGIIIGVSGAPQPVNVLALAQLVSLFCLILLHSWSSQINLHLFVAYSSLRLDTHCKLIFIWVSLGYLASSST